VEVEVSVVVVVVVDDGWGAKAVTAELYCLCVSEAAAADVVALHMLSGKVH